MGRYVFRHKELTLPKPLAMLERWAKRAMEDAKTHRFLREHTSSENQYETLLRAIVHLSEIRENLGEWVWEEK